MERPSPEVAVSEILVNLAHAAEAVVQLYDGQGPKAERILSQVEELLDEVVQDLRPSEREESRPREGSLQAIDRARAVAIERGWREAVEALDRLGVSLARFRSKREEPSVKS
jgi:hypothetical protein